MAGSKSDYLENKVLDHFLGVASTTMPTSLWLALYTAAPTDAGGGTECAAGDYARLELISAGDPNVFDSAALGVTENTTDWEWSAATSDWGTIVAFGIFDAVSGGNLYYWGDISPTKSVGNGDTAKFLAGDLQITED